ncbi:MAG: CHAT domain-containing protein [Xenococcus sp. MO_188.B8]|nr:CHAT domain-containing protein [Xenococcus sp. MO_188.B8]
MTAEPTSASRLRLGEEFREIHQQLRLSSSRDYFAIHQRMSIRPIDMTQAFLDINPYAVHFSGHGTADGALCFENMLGEMHPIHPEALAALFKQFPNIQCVILNACYSIAQADAIAAHIPFVIGMNKEVGDKAAIAFSTGFYQALGAKRSISDAYELGCVQIQLQGIPEYLTPTLVQKTGQAKHIAIERLKLQHKQVQTSDNFPHELEIDGPSGGRKPKSRLIEDLIWKASTVENFIKKRMILEEASNLDPYDPVVYRLLAWFSQRLTDYSAAIRYDHQAIHIDGSYGKAYVGLVISGNRTGDYATLQNAWVSLRNVCSETERPFHEGAYWYADSQESFGNYAEAYKWFKHITENWWEPLSKYEEWLQEDARKQVNLLHDSLSDKISLQQDVQ